MSIDIAALLPYLKSTSNLALACREFNYKVRSNGFPIRTSEGTLCPENFSLFKSLGYPGIDKWINEQFFHAIEYNKPEYLQLLLQSGADLEAKNARGDKDTALIVAVRYNNTKCLQLLLQNRADLEARNSIGSTALIVAAIHGKTDCLKLLLEHKANVEASNYFGFTALKYAFYGGHNVSVKILLECGAKVDPELDIRFSRHPGLRQYSTQSHLRM